MDTAKQTLTTDTCVYIQRSLMQRVRDLIPKSVAKTNSQAVRIALHEWAQTRNAARDRKYGTE